MFSRAEEKPAWLSRGCWWMRRSACLYSVETRVEVMGTGGTIHIHLHLRVATI